MASGGAGSGPTPSLLFSPSSSSLSSASSSSSLFGAPHRTGPASLFGDPSGFGQSIPASNSIWPSQTSKDTIPPDGSRAAKWQLTHIPDTSASDQDKYVTISAMQPFQQFSVEEIRLQDYIRGDKGGDQSQNSALDASLAALAFGATSAPAPGGGIFGQSQPAFGGGSFRATTAPAFGASTSAPSLFGNSTTQCQSGLFGAPAQANMGANLFGAPQQPNTTTNLIALVQTFADKLTDEGYMLEKIDMKPIGKGDKVAEEKDWKVRVELKLARKNADARR